MWIIDVQHDLDWVAKLHQIKKMPEASLNLNFSFQSKPEYNGYWKLYGDEGGPKLLRIVLPNINSIEEAQRFIALKLGKMIRHVEVSITLSLGSTFYFNSPFGGPPTMKYLTSGKMTEADLPLHLKEIIQIPPFDYMKLGQVLAGHFFDFDDYSELLQSGMNTNLKVEYRWLDFYKLLEMHFGEHDDLDSKNKGWIEFLERFRKDIQPYLRDERQTLDGFMIQVRNAAAHYAIASGRKRNEKARAEVIDKINKTFPIIAKMLVTIINEYPDNTTFKLDTNFNSFKENSI